MSMKLIRIFLGRFLSVQRHYIDIRHTIIVLTFCCITHSKMRINIDITVAMKCQREYRNNFKFENVL